MGALPSERRVKDMTDGDYLYCVLHLLLDQEDRLEQLCPQCRSEALAGRCPGCGAVVSHWRGEENGSFDEERFRALSAGR